MLFGESLSRLGDGPTWFLGSLGGSFLGTLTGVSFLMGWFLVDIVGVRLNSCWTQVNSQENATALGVFLATLETSAEQRQQQTRLRLMRERTLQCRRGRDFSGLRGLVGCDQGGGSTAILLVLAAIQRSSLAQVVTCQLQVLRIVLGFKRSRDVQIESTTAWQPRRFAS